MTPDHSALIERLEGAAPHCASITHKDLLAEAAAALRDQQDRREGMEEDLYQAVLVAYRRGAVEWARLNYPKWFDAISTGREVCPSHPPPTKQNRRTNQ